MTTYPLHHFSRVIIALTVKLILIVMVDAHAQPAPTHAPSHIIKYTTITGYFLQDDPSTNASTFDYVKHPLHPLPFLLLPYSPLVPPPHPINFFFSQPCPKLPCGIR